MSPRKMPAFAVCGGVSVETVITGAGRRRNGSKANKRSAVVGSADSLYADLLWDCGGANVENAAVAAGMAFPTREIPSEDFSDVFGGPPKFATISAKLSCGILATNLSRTNEMLSIECAASNSVGSDEPHCQTPLCSVQESFENLACSPSSAKFVKVRSATDVSSSHICFSDGDNVRSAQRKVDRIIGGKEVSTVALSRAFPWARNASTLVRKKESFGSYVAEDLERLNFLKVTKEDQTSMKENIEGIREFSKREEGRGTSATVNEKTAHFRNGSHDRNKNLGLFSQFSKQMENHKLEFKFDNPEEVWVSIRDVQCATEPSQFPPPSRPPPELRFNSTYFSKHIDEAASNVNELQNGSGLALPKQSSFDSGFMTSSCTSELNVSTNTNSRNKEDAVDVAEAKIRMVLEAREKAKFMVEKKLREKRRAQQLKNRIARDAILGKGGEHGKANTKARAKHYHMNESQKELFRQRENPSQCIEKATQETSNDSGLNVQKRAAELRFFPNMCQEPLERNEHIAKTEANRTPTVHMEPRLVTNYFWLEASRDYHHKQSFCGIKSQKTVEEAPNEPREQQQDCISGSRGFVEQELNKSTFEVLDSMSSTLNPADLFSGTEPSSITFQHTAGESEERQLARWDRDCRTAARMEKALEEKRQRDRELQKEQAERQRAAEILDDEIRVWAAGKERNLEALLCSLHLVLWPECGWKSMTPADLSTIDAVKKAYRRATLFVHPDKVQQRGATVTQKYVAEKVFDVLREASTVYK